MSTLDLGLVGNCSIGALIDAEAEVTWACFPRFDGDAVFCSLLRERGGERDFGYVAVDVVDAARTEQAYLDNTAVLVTRIHDRQGGIVEVTGFAPPFRQHGRTFCPMLALGVPSGPIPAVMLAALMVHGVSPGPLLITQQPELFWGFIASMYVGNLMLLALNLPMVVSV